MEDLNGRKLLDKEEPKYQGRYDWKITDKLEICKKENIDIMIDDDYKIIEQLSKNNIKLYILEM